MSRVAVVVCASSLLLALVAWKAPRAQSLPCSLAEEAADEGHAARALAAFDLCLETAALSDEQRARAHVARGLLYLEDARLDCALADLDQAVWLAPAYAPAYLARGETYLAKAFITDGDQGEINCAPSRSAPGQAMGSTIQENKAGGLRVAGQTFSSRREAERWLQQQRQIADLQQQLVALQQQRAAQEGAFGEEKDRLLPREHPLQTPGEVTRGLADFSRALWLSPDLAAALAGRATAHCLLGSAEAAQADWQRLVRRNQARVLRLQSELAESAFYKGKIDGRFGPSSRAALAAFAEARCR